MLIETPEYFLDFSMYAKQSEAEILLGLAVAVAKEATDKNEVPNAGAATRKCVSKERGKVPPPQDCFQLVVD